jgi:Bax protein
MAQQLRRNWAAFLGCVLIVLIVAHNTGRNKTFHVNSETVQLQSLKEVVALTGNLVKPLLYTNVSGLGELPTREAKRTFIATVLPSILIAKYQIEQNREKIYILQRKRYWTAGDSAFYYDMRRRYRAVGLTDLPDRMVTLPNSVILAQTAVESGWGQSRFFLQARNLFGVWSFNAKEPRMPASRKRKTRQVYVRSYDDMAQSISHYFEILARSRSYRELREAMQRTQDPFELLPHLKYYSERRSAYTHQLKKMIIANNLTQYDTYQLDPAYLLPD